MIAKMKNRYRLREKIWSKVLDYVDTPIGMRLPTWVLAVRAILYPLDFFYWKLDRLRGYQADKDSLIVEGLEYPVEIFRELRRSRGGVYEIKVDKEGRVILNISILGGQG